MLIIVSVEPFSLPAAFLIKTLDSPERSWLRQFVENSEKKELSNFSKIKRRKNGGGFSRLPEWWPVLWSFYFGCPLVLSEDRRGPGCRIWSRRRDSPARGPWLELGRLNGRCSADGHWSSRAPLPLADAAAGRTVPERPRRLAHCRPPDPQQTASCVSAARCQGHKAVGHAVIFR